MMRVLDMVRGMLAVLVAGVMVCALACGGTASALTPVPAWRLITVAKPTVIPAGSASSGEYLFVLENVGAAASEGEAAIHATLPAGVTVTSTAGCESSGSSEVVCPITSAVVPGGFVVGRVAFTVPASLGEELHSVASASGGGAPSVTKETATRVVSPGETAPAGINEFAFEATGPTGESVAQAGGHPTSVTTSSIFNSMLVSGVARQFQPVEAVKNLVFYLPLGFLGDPETAQRCPVPLVLKENPEIIGVGECPSGSRVGTVLPVELSGVGTTGDPTQGHPIFNVAPERGYAAEFAYTDSNFLLTLYANVVRHDGRYMVRVAVPAVPPFGELIAQVTSFYGDLSEQNSGLIRDLGAFLTNPSACNGEPLNAGLEINTWEHPQTAIVQNAVAYQKIEGCPRLRFSAALGVKPASSRADEPSGYAIGVEAPQAPNVFTGLGTPPYRRVSVTLPAGVSLSPSAANGLTACPAMGPGGINIEGGESEAVAVDGLPRPVAGHCPVSSRVASVRASSPDLGEELTGHIFVATPGCGGVGQAGCGAQDARDGNLFGLYLELEAPGAGVVVKLPGEAMVDPVTGQVTTVFDQIPQFPVEDTVIETTGGPRAPFANPQACGAAASTGDVTPWSSPVTADAISSSVFSVDWDGSGGACPAVLPFSPGFSAGVVEPVAGAFSPVTVTIGRRDREQDLSGISVSTPPGVSGILKGVPLCGEPQAAQGTCPAGSQIGTTSVAAGAGSEPYWQQGRVYLTTGYRGQPFGLSVVVPAVAGPFNLGNIVVRASIHVDPVTAALTVVSDPLPQMVDGIPLRIQTVNVTVDRPGFTFNPTNCSQLHVTGTITGAQGASASVSSPFAVTGCSGLPFKPVFTVSTQARTSKKVGASLMVRTSYPAGSANIHSVAVTLPVQLPARLTTIQQACTEAVFAVNPASCPVGSNIGTATATTPILANPVSGPVYLVSHGGAAFPDVVAVLQGEGVTVDLVGSVNIKHNITSSTFANVPDVPVSGFLLTLPEGPHSGLGANLPAKAKGSFCGQSLTMPTTIVGQNGAVFKQNTKIAVTGCPRAKKKAKARRAKRSSIGVKRGRAKG
jgi:hypothetical protein